MRAIDMLFNKRSLTYLLTQHGEKPVTVHSGDASSTLQHSIKGHANEEEE